MEKLNEILGYKKEVETLKSVCDFLKNTEKYLQFGAEIPKGLLIYGQSGVGKTFMAKALIQDCGRVPFFFKGDGRKGIKKLFKKAKKAGRAVIFFDRLDYWSEDGDSEEFFQLSDEMEEIENGDVFVIATCVKSDSLPDYLLDDDVFGIKIELDPPGIEDAMEIFKPIFANEKTEDNFNIADFCSFACGWTYPMAERVFNTAALSAVYKGSEQITMRHIVEAALRLNDTPLAEKYEEETAYHEAGHAAAYMLLGGEANCVILLEEGGFFRPKEQSDETYSDRERRYISGIAGKACTEVFFKNSVFGTSSDLQSIADGLENDMSKLASQGFEFYDTTKELNNPKFNDRLANNIQSNMQNYYDKAKLLIERNKPLIVLIAEKLKEKHFLLSSELHKIYEEYSTTKKS